MARSRKFSFLNCENIFSTSKKVSRKRRRCPHGCVKKPVKRSIKRKSRKVSRRRKVKRSIKRKSRKVSRRRKVKRSIKRKSRKVSRRRKVKRSIKRKSRKVSRRRRVYKFRNSNGDRLDEYLNTIRQHRQRILNPDYETFDSLKHVNTLLESRLILLKIFIEDLDPGSKEVVFNILRNKNENVLVDYLNLPEKSYIDYLYRLKDRQNENERKQKQKQKKSVGEHGLEMVKIKHPTINYFT